MPRGYPNNGINTSGVKRGYKQSDKHRANRSKALKGRRVGYALNPNKGEMVYNWKGEDVCYASLHIWVSRWKGKPRYCEMCGSKTAKRFEWANIDHKYRRVLEDYIRMCTSCHKKYDYSNHLANIGCRYGSIKNKI